LRPACSLRHRVPHARGMTLRHLLAPLGHDGRTLTCSARVKIVSRSGSDRAAGQKPSGSIGAFQPNPCIIFRVARTNYVAAGLFHAAELKLTRPKKWLHKISSAYWWTSLGYQAVSDFGNSIGRPTGCFVVTMMALVALAYEVGTAVARKDAELNGWQLALKDGELLRASQYAMQSINPLNLFGSPLVVISDKWGAIAGGILGVIGIATFALFLLSVRRRFKLE
jgi:hypothetical protein